MCSPQVSEKYPIFPGRVFRLSWPFDDPSALKGDALEIDREVRRIRDQIKEKTAAFVEEFENKGLKMFMEEQS